MKCEGCGGQMTTERNAVIRYAAGGLPHVMLQGVEVSRCQKCGKEEVGIPRIGQLHHVIAMALVKQPRMLAPVEVRFLRKHMGYSTGEFAGIMGVARETASRWESGTNPMGATTDRLLRVVVLTHEPIEDYAAKDAASIAVDVKALLEGLNDTPAPAGDLKTVPMHNRAGAWTGEPKKDRLAKV